MKKINHMLAVLSSIALTNTTVSENGDDVKVEGYACTFNEENHNGLIVTKDSFDKLFEEMKEKGLMPSMNLMHGTQIVGVWDELVPDNKGLYAKGRLVMTDFVKNNVLPLMQAGALNYLSTEGYIEDGYWDEKDAMVATVFNLIRISLVDVPADFNAKIDMVENSIALRRYEHKKEREAKNRLARLGIVI